MTMASIGEAIDRAAADAHASTSARGEPLALAADGLWIVRARDRAEARRLRAAGERYRSWRTRSGATVRGWHP